MSVTPERLAEKRLRAEQLRQEIATLELASRTDLAAAELVNQDAALDAEIAALEAKRNETIELGLRSAVANGDASGGSVAEALAAMEAAQAEADNKAAVAPASRPALGASTSTEGEGK